MTMDDSVTLGEAREWLRERVSDGERCPLCTQHAKVYRRKLNSGMVRALILMWHAAGYEWQRPSLSIDNSGTLGKLRYWGLIEPGEERGIWRVTHDGARFLYEMLTVPSHVEIYDEQMLRLDGDLIGIRDALGTKFDYDELMRTPGTSSPGF